MARIQLKSSPNSTLQPTELISEAYLKLAGNVQSPFQDRKHFLALAARVMRQVLVDRARERNAIKRGSGERPVQLNEALDGFSHPDEFLLLNDALSRLEAENAVLARVIELRYFAGLKIHEVADLLHCSTATVTRQQHLAEAWLARALSSEAR